MKLVFLGDSLTEYFDWQARFPSYQVLNLGIAGEPIEGLLKRLDRIRSKVGDPHFVFVMTGINNVAMEEYEIAGRYRKILLELTSWSTSAQIVVQSILPVILPWIENGVIEGLNNEIRAISGELGLEYLDIYSLFVDQDRRPISQYLLEDGVHLSAEGYEVWSDAVEKLVQSG